MGIRGLVIQELHWLVESRSWGVSIRIVIDRGRMASYIIILTGLIHWHGQGQGLGESIHIEDGMFHHPDRGNIGVWIVRISRLEARNDVG